MAGDRLLTDVMNAGEGGSHPKEHTCALEPPLQTPFIPVHLKNKQTKTKAPSKMLHKAQYIWFSHICLGPIRTQGPCRGDGEGSITAQFLEHYFSQLLASSRTNLHFSHPFLIVLEPSPLLLKWDIVSNLERNNLLISPSNSLDIG